MTGTAVNSLTTTITQKDAADVISLKKIPKTVEDVKAYWVKEFKKDAPKMVEIFHVGGVSCVSQEIFVVGMTEAAIETGHSIQFIQGGESDDDPPESKLAQ